MSALSGAHAGQLDALAITLQLAVPLQMWELRHCDDQQRVAMAAAAADVVASHGDDLQFGGRHCAEAFNALARGLAIGAHQPGGITFRGLHWCTSAHEGCPTIRPDLDGPASTRRAS